MVLPITLGIPNDEIYKHGTITQDFQALLVIAITDVGIPCQVLVAAVATYLHISRGAVVVVLRQRCNVSLPRYKEMPSPTLQPGKLRYVSSEIGEPWVLRCVYVVYMYICAYVRTSEHVCICSYAHTRIHLYVFMYAYTMDVCMSYSDFYRAGVSGVTMISGTYNSGEMVPTNRHNSQWHPAAIWVAKG